MFFVINCVQIYNKYYKTRIQCYILFFLLFNTVDTYSVSKYISIVVSMTAHTL